MNIYCRILIKTLFIIIIVLPLSIEANTENCASFYQVTATQLNVRSQPNTLGNIIGTLHQGDEVCIAQRNRNWGKIDNGWVSTKHLRALGNKDSNYVQSNNASNSNHSSDGDAKGGAIILGILIVLAFIFFALKTLFYHTLISLGMAEPDGRAKNGIRLTRLGKFLASISGLIIFFIIILIGSMSK